MNITVDQVVQVFVTTRDEITKKEKEFKVWKAEQKELQETRSRWLQKFLEDSGQTGAKTKAGTIFFKRTERVKVADWDAFLAYVKSTDQWELLTKVAAKTAVLECMGDMETIEIAGRQVERRPNKPPSGLDYTTIREVGVNRPTN